MNPTRFVLLHAQVMPTVATRRKPIRGMTANGDEQRFSGLNGYDCSTPEIRHSSGDFRFLPFTWSVLVALVINWHEPKTRVGERRVVDNGLGVEIWTRAQTAFVE